MKRSSYMRLIFIAHLAALVLLMAAPASVMSQTITITTIEQLQKIGNDAAFPADGNYALGDNINATAASTWNGGEGFAPLGSSIAPFSGSFDGQGYAIQGLHINRPTADNVGLFGYVSGSGAPASIRNVALENADIKGKSVVGALVGYKVNCLVYNCSSTGSVSAQANYAGGLMGKSQDNTPITNCYSTCAVTGQLAVGGLVGYSNICLIKNCYSTGAVTAVDYAGGLVGWSQAGAQINNCYSTSAVTGQNSIGGLVGYNDTSTITMSYSAGRVSVTENRTGSLIGGLIGWTTTATASDCFWDVSASGQSTSAGGTGKSTADMMKRSTFTGAGWDFSTIWGISENKTYPFFRGSKAPPQAAPDSYSTGKNIALTVQSPGVLDNDIDPNGDALTAILVEKPAHGSVSLKTDGSFTYTPETNFTATDSFTYKAHAGEDNSTAASVTLVVGNAAPKAVADSYSTNRDLARYVAAPGVLGNDSDPNSDTLTAVLVDGPKHGALEKFDETGWFSYYPEKGFLGTDNFTYYASDGDLQSAPALVVIEVTPYCPLLLLFGEDSAEVETLRRFRDEVLATTAIGRAGIHIYYRMAPMLEGIVKNSTSMQRMTKSIITSALPRIRERLHEGQ